MALYWDFVCTGTVVLGRNNRVASHVFFIRDVPVVPVQTRGSQ